PARPRASSTSPVLSDTERRARRIWLIELIRLSLGALPATLGQRPYRYPAARDLESALGVETDGLRVETVLLGQDPGRQRRLCVSFEHRDGRLQHDRAGVHALVHEVDGGPCDLGPVLERLALSVKPWEGRQERGVDVQDPPPVAPHERTREDTHVAG